MLHRNVPAFEIVNSQRTKLRCRRVLIDQNNRCSTLAQFLQLCPLLSLRSYENSADSLFLKELQINIFSSGRFSRIADDDSLPNCFGNGLSSKSYLVVIRVRGITDNKSDCS